MDDDKKVPNDKENTTNAEYVDQQDLDIQEDKDGNPIDAIEQNQNEEELSEENAKQALSDGIAGNDDNTQDASLNEENN